MIFARKAGDRPCWKEIVIMTSVVIPVTAKGYGIDQTGLERNEIWLWGK